jgi:hypothetical protein
MDHEPGPIQAGGDISESGTHMTTHSISALLRAAGAAIAIVAMTSAMPLARAFADEPGQWVLWKGSDVAGGDKMYLYCVQNGQRIVDLSGLKSFSEYLLDGKVNRVRFKYNLDASDDPSAYRVLNVGPVAGTLCQWGMAE